MHNEDIKDLLEKYKSGEIDVDAVMQKIRSFETLDLGYAKIDHHRAVRQGVPEVIYAEGKTISQTTEIFRNLYAKNAIVMATRASEEKYLDIKKYVSEAVYYDMARIIAVEKDKIIPKNDKYIAICAAGTSDLPVAEEAAVTAEILGNNVKRIYDVGVAGIHRLLAHQTEIQNANVVVVVAGMEGALASVVGGLVDKPIVAVPTSVGYGASFNGLAALLTMLNSCASGVGVVNIDNGFGAGYLASSINRL